ncbi:MAG: hypothetical protein ACP5E5_15000 [Acidobacteriaceae bacterium]
MTFPDGLRVIHIALRQPLDARDDGTQSVSRMQHLPLMSITPPPLLLMDYPLVPSLRGMPKWAKPMAAHIK